MFLLSDISNRDPLNKSEGLTPLKRESQKKDFSVEGKKKVITKERRRRKKKYIYA
jgi:hypothetical protein